MAFTSQQRLVTIIVASTVILFGGLVFALSRMPSGGATGEIAFQDEQSPSKGKTDAPVVVRFYSDFQCPACKAVEPILKSIQAQYQDRVKFVWKDFPLMMIHPNARMAANAARCAEAQGKFWEYHDTLYETQEGWSNDRAPKSRFVQFARDLGLNEGDFTKCYDDRQFDDKVMNDVEEGEKNGVDSTPSFFINNRPALVSSEAQWRTVLDAALRAAAASSTAP